MPTAMRFLIVDDHLLYLGALATIIEPICAGRLHEAWLNDDVSEP